MSTNKNDKTERRYLSHKVEIRTNDETPNEVEIFGYAAVFNSQTNLGWMDEVIMPGAFDNCLTNDVRCLLNHDPNVVLGRGNNSTQNYEAKSSTMLIGVDTHGLWYRVRLDLENPQHKSVYLSIKRGDISQSSFAFDVKESLWEKTPDGENNLRKIVKCDMLYDVSPVTYPAYADTSVAKRSKPSDEPPPVDHSQMEVRLKLLKLKSQTIQ